MSLALVMPGFRSSSVVAPRTESRRSAEVENDLQVFSCQSRILVRELLEGCLLASQDLVEFAAVCLCDPFCATGGETFDTVDQPFDAVDPTLEEVTNCVEA